MAKCSCNHIKNTCVFCCRNKLKCCWRGACETRGAAKAEARSSASVGKGRDGSPELGDKEKVIIILLKKHHAIMDTLHNNGEQY